MVKQINKNINHVAKLGRSSFDMTKDVKFTSSVGQLLPVYWDILSPNEKVKIGASMFTRTKPLASPAFVSINEHVDYFFVPLRQLYRFFENKFFDVNHYDTSLVGSLKRSINLPTFNLLRINAQFHSDYFHKNQEFYQLNNYGTPTWMDYLRLLDLFGLNYKPFYKQIVEGEFPAVPFVNENNFFHVNAFPFLAYQKIYYDHYRITEFFEDEPSVYNADSFELDNFDSDNIDSFRLHYRPFHKDYFTNIKPQPLIDTINSLGLQFSLKDYDGQIGLNNYQVFNPSYNDSGSPLYYPVAGQAAAAHKSEDPQSISASVMRAAFAYDKLLQITHFAPNDVDAQITAHFGFKVPQGVDGRVVYLGSDDSRIDVGEVASTSDTLSSDGAQGAQLGALAGKGAGYREGKATHEFTAPVHGILMAIYSSEPTCDYAPAFDKLLQYTDVNNYYRPEFENLGMQPLYASELTGFELDSDEELPTSNFVLGFQYRWSELKQKYSTIHGDFLDTLPDWVINRNRTSNVFGSIGFRWLYVSPCTLDSITETNFAPSMPPYDGAITWDDTVFTRDPLMHWFTIHCYKTSTMSMYDLPQL